MNRKYSSTLDDSIATVANRAVTAALDDCGLERQRIDGLVVHVGSPRGLDYDEMATLLALTPRCASQTWSHGRFCGTVIQHAAMALDHGLADYILCVATFLNTRFTHHGTTGFPGFSENLREGSGPHAETLYAGLLAPVGGTAMALQRYLHKYRVDREKLAAVAMAQRKSALLNPLAVMKQPITLADYVASPYEVEPVRRLDCSVPVDTSVAVVLTRAERARDLDKPPVYLRSYQGIAAGRNEFVFGQRGLGINQSEEFDYTPQVGNEPVFRAAGATPGDIQTLHCYDGFRPHVLWTLERFGFARYGSRGTRGLLGCGNDRSSHIAAARATRSRADRHRGVCSTRAGLSTRRVGEQGGRQVVGSAVRPHFPRFSNFCPHRCPARHQIDRAND
jgi:acetyl-CoA acetyltransferase